MTFGQEPCVARVICHVALECEGWRTCWTYIIFSYIL